MPRDVGSGKYKEAPRCAEERYGGACRMKQSPKDGRQSDKLDRRADEPLQNPKAACKAECFDHRCRKDHHKNPERRHRSMHRQPWLESDEPQHKHCDGEEDQ